MTSAILARQTGGAMTLRRIGRTLMDVILHVGAHRTATTSFQHFAKDHMHDLSAAGVAFWGPQDTRKSVFPGLFRTAALQRRRDVRRRAEGRIKMLLAELAVQGTEQVLVSDENMIGTCVQNFRHAALYPAIGERMARVAAAFDDRISRVVLTLRAQDLWWASAAAMTVARGHAITSAAKCAAISQHARSWRDVVTDLACAVPDAQIEVMPFEQTAGQSDVLLSTALGRTLPLTKTRPWLNRSADLNALRRILDENGADARALPQGTGRWNPFTPEQCAEMRERYADDLHWLTAGADGLAHLTRGISPQRADISPPPGTHIKGQSYDEGHLAQHR